MNLLPIVLALGEGTALAPTLSVSTALLLIAVGLLVFIAKAIADLRADVEALRERLSSPPPSPGPAARPAAPQVGGDTDLEPTLRAVIAAAVHTAMADQPYRIVAVAQAGHDAGWSLEGRRQVFQSHQVR